MTKYEKNLMKFARQTLAIMENDIDWSADTFDEIEAIAFELSLAGSDEHGQFMRLAEYNHHYTGQEALDLN